MKSISRFMKACMMVLSLFLPALCQASDGEPLEKTVMLLKSYDVSFKDSRGNVISLSQLRGKVVLINLWATWCPPCLAEMPSLDKLYKDFQGNSGIIFLSVDIDGRTQAAEKFLKKRKYSLPVYQLHSGLPRELSTQSIPTTIILDKAGKLVNKHVGGMNFGSPKFRKALQQLSDE
ncbi:TlpA family protein disulfide reductase [Sphingobacterium sp. N143]|uniref:TlpA family protein disulfide reductase n=1 Tax=Sphingobacterium sp. N143 TaxID=2746727 RepID=UPI0025775D3C|nr:TlpA disulfide reductase family protein [Sphingobacterium sp. N143]MDM1293320.1 TlpA family protein disulfide reductase [Sphingobacterium sp. N143]